MLVLFLRLQRLKRLQSTLRSDSPAAFLMLLCGLSWGQVTEPHTATPLKVASRRDCL